MKSQDRTPLNEQTLAQRMVEILLPEAANSSGDVDAERKYERLPDLLRRSGLLQTVLFLERKDEADRRLLQALSRCTEGLLGETLRAEKLAKLPVEQYWMVERLALQAAVLLSRLLKAMKEDGKNSEGAGEHERESAE